MKTIAKEEIFHLVHLQKIKILSIYNKCERAWTEWVEHIGDKALESTKWSKNLLIKSSAKAKRRGDKGSSCRSPQEQENQPTVEPFNEIKIRVDCRILKIQLTNFLEKTNLESTHNNNNKT